MISFPMTLFTLVEVEKVSSSCSAQLFHFSWCRYKLPFSFRDGRAVQFLRIYLVAFYKLLTREYDSHISSGKIRFRNSIVILRVTFKLTSSLPLKNTSNCIFFSFIVCKIEDGMQPMNLLAALYIVIVESIREVW